RDWSVTGVQTCALPIWEADFALAHFALAIMLRRQGRVSESRARLLRLSRMLADVPSETILAGPEEISCGWLRSLVSHHLDGHGEIGRASCRGSGEGRVV